MSDINLLRLRLVMALFRIRAKDICRATRFSKSYVGLVLGGKLKPSDAFIMKLNDSMAKLLTDDGRAGSVFALPPTQVEADDKTLDALNRP